MRKFLPGSLIGILGGGQLGRMLALEARRMGYRTMVLDPAPAGPCAQVADAHIQAPLNDPRAALKLAMASDVVTLEWELIPAEVLEEIEKIRPLHPGSGVLRIIQDRLRQKEFLNSNGFPQAAYSPVNGLAALEEAVLKIGFPCILKRRRQGYDGKGQILLRSRDDLDSAAGVLEAPCVLERKIDFDKEISVILARTQTGDVAVYPVAENEHKNGILHMTRAPARIPAALEQKAEELAMAIAEALGHAGVMAVEMFLQDGGLLINEIAPRVHNSGHFTWGACATSQFEQHLRAVCGLPLGETRLLQPALMVNLLGDLWQEGEPDWSSILARPNLKLHLYGKAPAPRRKMGHILILGEDAERSLELAELYAARTPAL